MQWKPEMFSQSCQVSQHEYEVSEENIVVEVQDKQTKQNNKKYWRGGLEASVCFVFFKPALSLVTHYTVKGLSWSWVPGIYTFVCLFFFFFKYTEAFQRSCFSLVERNTSRLWAGTSALPYFPHRLPLIPLLAVLFARPTFLLGVPRLAQRALLSSAEGCPRSGRSSAAVLGALHAFLCSQALPLGPRSPAAHRWDTSQGGWLCREDNVIKEQTGRK